ncbi:hypothetical protein KJ359_007611 [Pestalotiopsis sp. 9143b]|nr:hypothetical protein KJ359_007611 [Pestalotiopsis sp. 9143b]
MSGQWNVAVKGARAGGRKRLVRVGIVFDLDWPRFGSPRTEFPSAAILLRCSAFLTLYIALRAVCAASVVLAAVHLTTAIVALLVGSAGFGGWSRTKTRKSVKKNLHGLCLPGRLCILREARVCGYSLKGGIGLSDWNSWLCRWFIRTSNSASNDWTRISPDRRARGRQTESH